LVKEKALTSARDELNSARRQLPMVEVTKQYTLHGEQGPVGMVDLFEGRDQLIVHHFMWTCDIDGDGVEHHRHEGCPSCSTTADDIGNLTRLYSTFARGIEQQSGSLPTSTSPCWAGRKPGNNRLAGSPAGEPAPVPPA
jgi:predicted dithiol-disulfide oxidoreductase (DUF899 family)